MVCKHEFGHFWDQFWIDFWYSLSGQFCAQSPLKLFLDCLLLLIARGHLLNILPEPQRKLFLRSFLGHGSLLARLESLGRPSWRLRKRLFARLVFRVRPNSALQPICVLRFCSVCRGARRLQTCGKDSAVPVLNVPCHGGSSARDTDFLVWGRLILCTLDVIF